MKKNHLIIIAVVAIIALYAVSAYNGMVGAQESATTALANVQSSYQRRADLIPNLVETVKGYAKHEEQTLTNVVEARSKATQVTLDASTLTPEKLKEFQAAQGSLSSALGKLIAIQENYPDLKANENFKDLQVQLEGTENRINEARNKYNAAVQSYNINIRTFPKTLFAGIFGFKQMAKFESEAGAEKSPQVKF
ncbi:MAG: LemA family protein [Prevotellaceae bacterium]|nr:LemA family protein [Prevotella sp.]MDD7257258.1 LemA family protein [Prevotellaceae bacterium]MDY6130324.1 LemA family protein [Prevotella sp.]